MLNNKFIGCLMVMTILCIEDVLVLEPSEVDLVGEESKQLQQEASKTYSNSQLSTDGEAGKRGYALNETKVQAETGRKNKERLQQKYVEEGANAQAHHNDDGYYASNHQESHGKKGYSYEDNGSYAKGHDTKGHHNVRKFDEYKKEREFFNEDRDASFKEKFGGLLLGKGFLNGDVKQSGYLDKVFLQEKFGVLGKSENGAKSLQESGIQKASGRDQKVKTAEELAKRSAANFLKEFVFKLKGS